MDRVEFEDGRHRLVAAEVPAEGAQRFAGTAVGRGTLEVAGQETGVALLAVACVPFDQLPGLVPGPVVEVDGPGDGERHPVLRALQPKVRQVVGGHVRGHSVQVSEPAIASKRPAIASAIGSRGVEKVSSRYAVVPGTGRWYSTETEAWAAWGRPGRSRPAAG